MLAFGGICLVISCVFWVWLLLLGIRRSGDNSAEFQLQLYILWFLAIMLDLIGAICWSFVPLIIICTIWIIVIGIGLVASMIRYQEKNKANVDVF